jgi:hypothetical protein
VEPIVLPVVVLGFFSCFLLLWFRSARIERHLADLARLVTLERGRTERTSGAGAEAIEGLLSSIRDLDQRIESHLGRLLALQAKSKLGEARDVVERKLHLQGYADVRLRVEEGSEPGEGRSRNGDTITRFSVEVTRRGVEYKGYAVVRDGVIVDSSLNPVYATFP